MPRQRFSRTFLSRSWPAQMAQYSLTALLSVLLTVVVGHFSGAIATSPETSALAQGVAPTPEELSAQGQRWFELGDYEAAAQAWQTAAAGFAASGNRLQQIRHLNNVAQAYQQLGRWSEADSTLAQSLDVLTSLGQTTATQQALWGQTWTVQGNLSLAQSQPRKALEAFEQAAAAYRAAGHNSGVLRSQVNQARALRAAGLYRRAIALLTSLHPELAAQPPTVEAAAGLRTLGEIHRTLGDLDASQRTLVAALTMSERLDDAQAVAATQLSLAHTAATAGAADAALKTYQQVATTQTPELLVQALIAQLPLLIRRDDLQAVGLTLDQLAPALEALPPGRLRAYGLIDAANALMNTQTVAYRATALAWLTEALDISQTVADLRAESYALGALGKLYQNAQQISDAIALTRRALVRASEANAPEITYLWNAQLGDLQRATGESKDAIANYTAAVNTLQTLRQDLVAIDDDVRYSFRETVEPIYRHLVDLLTAPGTANQQTLQQARTVIEALQLAELENFFREACLPVSENIDLVVDSTVQPTAILYPIILPDRLEVVLKLPQQPLTHYATAVSQVELDAKLNQLRRDAVLPHTLNRVKAEAKELYDWLIAPALPQLSDNHITTLVFVLDGALRNIPMGLLYTGDHYLIEDFGVAIAPGLQLVAPKALPNQNLSVIIAGISEERPSFPPLPFVEVEVRQIESAVSSQVLFNQAFTVERLESVISESPFPVVHLATHGQFSSTLDDTFILAWDNRIPVTRLNSMLRNSEQSRQSAIELLVLSACQTATGDSRATLGLAGVAVRAGARSTLASLWNLDDETTALVMDQFYRAIQQPGTTRAEALRQAQRSLLSNPRFEHPRHWAPYVLIGNWL
ncbi:hypothetical protein C8255_03745 [filamentous cyanobacterium CCP3]|nr:hypothetical protein C8255_03745 [filamentous cyanobacterium CCP3]